MHSRCTKRQFVSITPRKAQTMLRWLRCSRGSQARHTLTSSITSCALTDTTLTVTDSTYLQRRVLRVMRGTQRTTTMCPTAGAQALTMSSLMSWYPCLSGPALHCRVPFSPFVLVFSPKSTGHKHFVVFLLDRTCFRRSCCLVPALLYLRTDHWKRLKDKSDAPAETRGDWPRTSSTLKKRTKLPSSHLPMNGVCQPHQQ